MTDDTKVGPWTDRKKMLTRVQKRWANMPLKKLIAYWERNQTSIKKDWVLHLAFALRDGFPQHFYEVELYDPAYWHVCVAILNRPNATDDCLRKAAGLKSDEPLPTYAEDRDSKDPPYSASALRFIAREVLRHRDQEKKRQESKSRGTAKKEKPLPDGIYKK